jgi:hypothetical protein
MPNVAAWVNKGEIWPMIKRAGPDLRPEGERAHQLLGEAVVEFKKGDNDQLVRLR